MEYQEAVVTGGSIDIVKEISIPGVMYDVTMWAVNGSQYSQPPVTIPAILLQLAQGRYSVRHSHADNLKQHLFPYMTNTLYTTSV